MSGRQGLEPYDSKQLYRLLAKTFGGVKLSQDGSRLTLRLPNGVELECPDPGSRHVVTTVNARQIAARMGRDLQWLRRQLGYVQLSTAPSRLASATAPISKHETEALVRSTTRQMLLLLQAVENGKPGPHSDELRRRISKELTSVASTVARLADLAGACA